MREFIRQSLILSFSLYLTAAVFSGLSLNGGLADLFWAGIVCTLTDRLAKPLIKLILLPLHLLTLGLFSWLNQILVLLIADQILPALTIRPALIPAVSWSGFSAPAISLNLFSSLVITGLILYFIYQLLEKALCPDY